LIRVITPARPTILAGITAMIQLEPAGNSDRHFLMPLPPGLQRGQLGALRLLHLRVAHRARAHLVDRSGAIRPAAAQHQCAASRADAVSVRVNATSSP
jgi:hypothetical protein